VYGPVRTVVWQGSAGDRRPYADQTALADFIRRAAPAHGQFLLTPLHGRLADWAAGCRLNTHSKYQTPTLWD